MNGKYDEFVDIVIKFIKTYGFQRINYHKYYIKNNIFTLEMNNLLHKYNHFDSLNFKHYDSLTFKYDLVNKKVLNLKEGYSC